VRSKRSGERWAATRVWLGATLIAALIAGLAGCGSGAPKATSSPKAAVNLQPEQQQVPASPSASPSPSMSPPSASASLSAGTSASTTHAATCSVPMLIAHRGEGGNPAAYPEDTSAAEVDAVHHGADMMNADVQWTSDDVPVVIHDTTLDRTTTGTGPVANVTAAQFTALDLKGNNGALFPGDMHPQTLAQFIATVESTGVPLILQMESDPFTAPGQGESSIESFADAVQSSGYASKIIVSGWYADDVAAFQTIDPGMRMALIQETSDPTPAQVLSTGATILYIDYVGVTAAEVAAWHAGGLTVWVWTPPASDNWVSLTGMGVDGIATNWVSAYVDWARPARPCAATIF
jgi:glycerophosphoryl diester phosphodiesterase